MTRGGEKLGPPIANLTESAERESASPSSGLEATGGRAETTADAYGPRGGVPGIPGPPHPSDERESAATRREGQRGPRAASLAKKGRSSAQESGATMTPTATDAEGRRLEGDVPNAPYPPLPMDGPPGQRESATTKRGGQQKPPPQHHDGRRHAQESPGEATRDAGHDEDGGLTPGDGRASDFVEVEGRMMTFEEAFRHLSTLKSGPAATTRTPGAPKRPEGDGSNGGGRGAASRDAPTQGARREGERARNAGAPSQTEPNLATGKDARDGSPGTKPLAQEDGNARPPWVCPPLGQQARKRGNDGAGPAGAAGDDLWVEGGSRPPTPPGWRHSQNTGTAHAATTDETGRRGGPTHADPLPPWEKTQAPAEGSWGAGASEASSAEASGGRDPGCASPGSAAATLAGLAQQTHDLSGRPGDGPLESRPHRFRSGFGCEDSRRGAQIDVLPLRPSREDLELHAPLSALKVVPRRQDSLKLSRYLITSKYLSFAV